MSAPSWVVVVTVLGVALGCAVWVGDRVRDRVLERVLRRSRGAWWRAALMTLAYHAGALLLLALVAGMALSVVATFGDLWVGVVTAVVGVVGYLQLVWWALPTRLAGYGDLREGLAERDATEGQARAVAWVGGPMTLVGVSGSAWLIFELLG